MRRMLVNKKLIQDALVVHGALMDYIMLLGTLMVVFLFDLLLAPQYKIFYII